jgi:HlyD family secretion protein
MRHVVVRAVVGVILLAALASALLPAVRTPFIDALTRLRVAAFAKSTSGTLPEQAHRPRALTVTVTPARERDFVDRLFVSGTLVARDEALVGAQIDGLRIVELLAEDGDRVEKAQVLARLDRSQLDALLGQNDAALLRADAAIAQARNQIEQSEAMWAQASADLGRAKKLDPAIITQATLDQRIASARSSEAQVAGAKSALAVAVAEKRSREAERRELMVRIDRTDVRAPVAGIVSRRTARLGALAMSAGEALFRIISDGAIDLEAEVPEDALARLRLGMSATIDLSGIDNRTTGTVRLIASEVDKATRLGKVRIALPKNTDARIGSFASGRVEIARRLAVGIPATAVTQGAGPDTIAIVRDGRISLRTITPGVINDGLIEVNGLAVGESVVMRGGAFVHDGDEVHAITAEGAREATR